MTTPPRGFIALMSVLLISALLLVLVTSGSFSGFSSRTHVLDAEYKEQSRALADACVAQTLLELAHDPSYSGDATTTLDAKDTCHVGVITLTNLPTRATFGIDTQYANAYTFLAVVVDTKTLSVLSERELSTQ